MSALIKEAFKTTAWYKDDPRYHINKRNNIIVLWIEADDRGLWAAHSEAAHVETKEGWSIWMEGRYFSADDDWPEHFVWTFMPSREEINNA